MYIYKCPLRVSLFGGGSDYKEYFQRKPGSVIGFTIDKYTYLLSAKRHGLESYKYRLAYSKIEHSNSLEDIQHPAFREIFKKYDLYNDFDLSLVSELPARSGLSSSSALSVCLSMYVNNVLGKKQPNPMNRAIEAIKFEREILNEKGGIQDQLHCSYGGVNRFDFFEDDIKNQAFDFDEGEKLILNNSFILVPTGIRRFASNILDEQIKNTKNNSKDSNIETMVQMVDECSKIFSNSITSDSMKNIGEMLKESWNLKKTLSSSITNNEIDHIISTGINNGAYGAKLCGAGAGGFILFVIPASGEKRRILLNKINDMKYITLNIDFDGPKISEI